MTDLPNPKLDDAYGPAVKFTLVVQVILLFISSMVLDGGHTLRTVAIAMLAFWASVLILIVRNPRTAGKWDLVYVRAGFLPILVVTWLVAHRPWAG
jgi:hypothetical protein